MILPAGNLSRPPSSPLRKSATCLNRTAPDSERLVGEWNTCDLTGRGDTLEVSINGVPQAKATRLSSSSGHIGFQLEGIPIELRQVRVVRLD